MTTTSKLLPGHFSTNLIRNALLDANTDMNLVNYMDTEILITNKIGNLEVVKEVFHVGFKVC